jgi:hypothetical protein
MTCASMILSVLLLGSLLAGRPSDAQQRPRHDPTRSRALEYMARGLQTSVADLRATLELEWLPVVLAVAAFMPHEDIATLCLRQAGGSTQLGGGKLYLSVARRMLDCLDERLPAYIK